MSLERWPYANVEPEGQTHELYSIAVSLKRIADAMPTLRDRFAGQALCGLLASEVHSVLDEPSAALMAYQQADAMLIERERQS